MAELTGGCLCGAIRYSINAEPVMSGACHCRDCQYASGGSAAFVMIFPKSAVRLTKGTPRSYSSLAESGNRVRRSLCESAELRSSARMNQLSRVSWRSESAVSTIRAFSDQSVTPGPVRLSPGTVSIRRCPNGKRIPDHR